MLAHCIHSSIFANRQFWQLTLQIWRLRRQNCHLLFAIRAWYEDNNSQKKITPHASCEIRWRYIKYAQPLPWCQLRAWYHKNCKPQSGKQPPLQNGFDNWHGELTTQGRCDWSNSGDQITSRATYDIRRQYLKCASRNRMIITVVSSKCILYSVK